MTGWVKLGEASGREYWSGPGGDVYKRRVSEWNVTDANGAPMGARWDSTRAHYERFVALSVRINATSIPREG